MHQDIIRVDLPQQHAGIAAALRRAFRAAGDGSSPDDFETLLRRLN